MGSLPYASPDEWVPDAELLPRRQGFLIEDSGAPFATIRKLSPSSALTGMLSLTGQATTGQMRRL